MDELKDEHSVRMLNPLSQDLDAMRQTLLYGLLENIERRAGAAKIMITVCTR